MSIGGITGSTAIPLLEQVVRFTEARHEVLAGNVANIDTPGYRTRDLSLDAFQQALAEAAQTRTRPNESYSLGVLEEVRSDPQRPIDDAIKTILYHDDSDVGIEQQVAELTKNQMMHELAINVMTNQFALLQTAISERV